VRTSLRLAVAIAILAPLASRADASVTFVQAYLEGQGGVDGLTLAQDIVVSANGKHVYAVSEGDDALVRFDRDLPTGALTYVETIVDGDEDVEGLGSARALTISPDGKHVYVVSGENAGAVAVFSRSSTTGALTFVEAEKNGQSGVSGLVVGQDVVVSPDGEHVYALGFDPGAVLTFARDEATGALTFVEKDEEGANGLDGIGFATECVMSPDGKHLYVTGEGDDSVAVFARNADTGALTFVEAQRDGAGGVDGLDGASAIGISDDGAHVYAGGAADDGLAVFARDDDTGTLTFLEAFREGIGGVDGVNGPADVAVTPDGTLVLVAAAAESEIGVFARNPGTGRLTFVEAAGGSGLGDVNSLAFSTNGKHLYTTARASNAVALFAVESTPTTTITSTTSTSSTSVTPVTTTTRAGATTLPPVTSTSSTSAVPLTTSPTTTAPGTTLAPSTTTTTLPSVCVPASTTFDAIACRLALLADATTTTAGLGTVRTKLDRSVHKATDRVSAAHGICSSGKTKSARQRLARAKHLLARYVRRLRSRTAQQTVPAAIREPLAAEAAAIAADVRAFRAVVSCPLDA
jgi:6-phosphogluconolactonase (cycloisomerase 2 family)